jgi:hypothetical protein
MGICREFEADGHLRGILGKNENNFFLLLWHLHQVLSTLLECIYTKSLMERQQHHESLVPENICKHKLFKLAYFLGSQVLFTNMFLLMFQMVFPICSPCVLYFSPSCFVTVFLIILLPQSFVL